MNINYDKLPAHMQESARRYVEDGADVGGFLTALLSNNLFETYNTADFDNRDMLDVWIGWLYWEAPSRCWGSLEKVTAWQKIGGLNKSLVKAEDE